MRLSFPGIPLLGHAADQPEREEVWEEIEAELRQFEGPNGFEGPCEMIVAVGVK